MVVPGTARHGGAWFDQARRGLARRGEANAGRRPYLVVDEFEAALCDYTSAPYAVVVNSCTNALQLSLTWERLQGAVGPIQLPRRTYLGVLQAALRAGFEVEWRESYSLGNWQQRGWYSLPPTYVLDSARGFKMDMYGGGNSLCLSFHVAKQLPLGRGGAILTDNLDAANWFRAARMDGRAPGDPGPPLIGDTLHCPMSPDVAARGLDILSRWNDKGYSPPPLPYEEYADLSQWYP